MVVGGLMFLRLAAGRSLGRALENDRQAHNKSDFHEVLHPLLLSFNFVLELGSNGVFKPFIVVSNNCATFMKV